MQTYQTRRKVPGQAVAPGQQAAPSKSEMLHMSGAGAPQPMSPQLREKFEPGFGADFSNIRISRGHIPEGMGVQAVAQGTDILLDQSAGMDVLGHELAHVVQQAQGRVDGGFPVVENAALEQEADVMGQRVASGLTAQTGPQNGFGGEMMSIAPMSSASAPAQCKIGKHKPKKGGTPAPQQAAPAPAPVPAPAPDLDENAVLDAYGAKLRQEVNGASQNVTADSTPRDLLTGNRLLYMRSNTKDQEKLQKKQLTEMIMHGVNESFAQHMKNSTMPEIFQGEFSKPGHLDSALHDNPTDARLLDMQRQSDEISAGELGRWLDLMQQDPEAMRFLQNQTERVYRPMGSFDPVNNKGGIVGGEQNAGIYALNDLFLRSSGSYASVRSGGESAGAIRTQMAMKFMNRMFNKTGDVDSMDDNERRVYDRMLQMTNPAPAAAPQPASAQAAGAPFETEISDPVYEEVEEPNSTQEMQERVEAAEINRAIPRELFDEMTDERGHLLDVATIAAQANAASPSYLGMRGMFNEDRAAMEASDPLYLGMRGMFNEDRAANAARTPNYSGVKALFTEPKPSPPAAETSYAEMRTLFNPSLDPGALEARREARAAYQESSEASFSGNMRSLFCENRPKSVAEELGLPEAPGEKYVTGLTELEDLYEVEQEEAAAARAYAGESEQMFSGNKASGELERMMNLSDEEENELMKDVQILDPANDPPLFPEPAPAPAAKKKNHWWQFWR